MNKELQSLIAGVVSTDDIELYERLGFGGEGGVGTRPAVVVIDVQNRTVRREYPANCGSSGEAALPHIAELTRAARSAGVPVVFAYVAPKDDRDSSRFAAKLAVLQNVEQDGYSFVDEVSPSPEDLLIPKRHPSIFFGTPLVSFLIDRSVDTLIVTGATTSGCVRASATDAFALGYKVVVPFDAVMDRAQTSHVVNLFDINAKYGDVTATADIVKYLNSVGEGKS